MGGPSPLDAFAALTNPQAERIAAIAARVGQMTADCAVALLPLPLTPEARQKFEAKTVAAIADMLDEFGNLTPADRARFQEVATAALDRGLAHHEAGAAS